MILQHLLNFGAVKWVSHS